MESSGVKNYFIERSLIKIHSLLIIILKIDKNCQKFTKNWNLDEVLIKLKNTNIVKILHKKLKSRWSTHKIDPFSTLIRVKLSVFLQLYVENRPFF